MNTDTHTSEYMLLFRGAQWDKGLAPEEIQKVLGRFMDWFERLKAEGIAKTGQPLAREGKIVSGKKGTVSDGPFAESKEAIGGYFLLNVATLDQAVEIARQCPILEYGSTVEVRPVAQQCATQQRLNEQLAQATA
jgi:hypothetical protein